MTDNCDSRMCVTVLKTIAKHGPWCSFDVFYTEFVFYLAKRGFIKKELEGHWSIRGGYILTDKGSAWFALLGE